MNQGSILLLVGVTGLAILMMAPTALAVAAVRQRSRILGWLGFGAACVQLLPGFVAAATSNWLWTALLRESAIFGMLTLPFIVASILAFARVAFGIGPPGYRPRMALWVATVLQLGVVLTMVGVARGVMLLPRIASP